MKIDTKELEDSLHQIFTSPNESDSNGEEANIVDGLYYISRSLREIAKAIERHNEINS